MTVFSSLRTFLDFVFRRSQVEAEMEEEFRSHLRSRADDLEHRGLSRGEAEREARIEFGGYQRYKEECRERLGTRVLQELAADVRYGLRQLHRNSGVNIVAILILALGIGATTAMFCVVDTVLLRPLPYRQPGRLVSFFSVSAGSLGICLHQAITLTGEPKRTYSKAWQPLIRAPILSRVTVLHRNSWM
ncbi:MAG TPA: permease prefix domain 1-containing protein [Bryobacteraceae bacterium]